MSYLRVIPRDLFNEASLLKCLGHLYIEAEHRPDAVILDHEHSEPFVVAQDQSDGSTYVQNIRVWVNGLRVHLRRPMNSREAWPLYATTADYSSSDVAVFTEHGSLTQEFLRIGL